MRTLYLEVVGSNVEVKDVIRVCKGHYGKCTSRPFTTDWHVIAVDVDNIISEFRIIRELKGMKFVKVVGV